MSLLKFFSKYLVSINSHIKAASFSSVLLIVMLFCFSNTFAQGQPIEIITATTPLCSGGDDGSVSIEMQNQPTPPPFWYVLQNFAGAAIDTIPNSSQYNAIFENLTPGTYDIYVYSDSTLSFFVTFGTANVFDRPALTAYIEQENLICNSVPEGSFEVFVPYATQPPGIATGGYPGPPGNPCRGWSVTWDGPTMPSGGITLECPPEIPLNTNPFPNTILNSSYEASNLLAGDYEIIVADYYGCTDTLNIEISEPPPILPEFTINQPECTGDYGAVSVTLEPNDGTPGSEGFDIIWTGENNTDTLGLEVVSPTFLPYLIDSVEVGSISISVIDNNQCSESDNLIIIEPSLTALSGDTSICNGLTTQFSGTGIPATFDPWQSSNELIATIDNSGLLTAISPGVAIITYTTIDGCSASQEIEVNEIPTILAFPDTAICVGGTAILNAEGAGLSGTYTWSPPSTLNISSGDEVEASPSSTTTYTILGLNTATGCGNTTDVTVTIIPTPIMQETPDVDVCTGDTIPYINFVSVPMATEYLWTNDYPDVGIPESGSGNIGPGIIGGINGSDTIAFAEVTVIPYIDGCPGPADLFLINLFPDPEVDSLSSFEICSRDAIDTLIQWTSSIPGTTFNWTASASESTSGFPVNGSGDYGPITEGLIINNGSDMDTVFISVFPNVNGCIGPEYVFEFYVKPLPSIASFGDTICPDGVEGTVSAVGTPSGGTYQWTGGPSSDVYTVSNPGDSSFYEVSYTYDNCINYDTTLIVHYVLPELSVNNDSICQGQFGLLSATTNPAEPGSYIWDEGTPLNEQQIEDNPISTTTYTVEFTHDFSSCTIQSSGIIYVDSIPSISIASPDSDLTICSNESIILTASSNVGNGFYQWNTGDTTSTIFVDTNLTSIIQVVYEKNNCFDTASVTVIVNPAPILSITDISVCSGVDTVFTPTVAPSGGIYTWETEPVQNGSTLTVTEPSSSLSIPLTYEINGCIAKDTADLTVTPTPEITINTDNILICNGDNATLIGIPNSGQEGGIYTWNDFGSSNTQSIQVSPSENTTYNLLYNLNGCEIEDSVEIQVDNNPSLDIGNDTICPGENAFLEAIVSPLGGTFLWGYQGAVSSSISPDPLITTYYSVEYSLGACTVIDSAEVFISPLPQVDSIDTLFACGGELFDTVYFNSNIPGSSFTWFHSSPQIGLVPNNGTGNINSWPAPINTTNQSINGTISVYGLSNGCVGDTVSFIASILPVASFINSNSSQTICSDSPIVPIEWFTDVPGSVVNWNATSSSSDVSVSPQVGVGNIDSLLVISTSPITQTITIEATVNFGDCIGDTIYHTVNVNPIPDLNLSENQTICSGDSTLETSFASTSSNLTGFNWNLINTNIPPEISGYLSPSGVGQIPVMAIINQLDTAYTLQYEIQSVSDNCLGTAGVLSITIQPLPNIDAGESLLVCVGDTIVLNATGGSNLSWSNAIENGVSFPELTEGNFIYTVDGTDLLTGCSNSDQLQVTVNASPDLNLDIYEQTICAGGTASFEASGIPSGGNYSWSDPNATITGTLNVVVDANTVGTSVYTVFYDLNGCIASDSVTVNSLSLPEVILTGDTICTEGIANITSFINPNNPGGTYEWSPGGETTEDITILGLNIVGAAVDTNFTYTLTYTDIFGCSNASSTDVIVYDFPDVTAPPVTICEGDTAQLSALANIPNGSFTWYHSSDLETSIGTGASISVWDLNTPSEQFYVVYQVNGCSDTALVNVTVNENPLLNITNSDFSVCASSSSVLSVEVAPPTLSGTYIWAHDPSLNSAIVSVSPQQTTTFSVFFVSNDNCFSNSDSVTITVIQNPVADIVASDTSICLGDSVVLSSAFTGLNYEWFPSGETTEQITLNFSVVGSYTYTLNVSVPGCSEVASDEIDIVVNSTPEIFSLTASSDSLCLGDSLFLSSSVSPSGGVYTWTPGSITSSGELGYLPDNIGFNNYLLSYELNGCAVEDSISVFISPIPLVNATATAICSGDTSLLSATVDIPGGSFEWYEGISQVGTGASLELTPSDTTTYSVVYTTPAQCVNDITLVTAYSFEIPVISALSNYSICPSDTLSIDALVSISGGNYTWTNDQDSEISVNNPLIVSPNDTTLYTLDYEVDYGFGVSCSDTAQILVNVFEAPVIGDIATSICSDIAFDIVPDGSLLGNYIPNNTTYTWTYVSNPLVDGLNDNASPSPSIVGELINTSATAQTVTAIVTPQSNVSGLCEGVPFNINITVNPIPVVSVNAPVVCDSAEVTLSASVSPTGGTYSWLIDPVSISYGDTTQASIDVVTSTTTPFSLFYTASGCTAQFDSIIIIEQPTLSVSPIDTTICAGETAVFVASANPLNGTYVWSVATQPAVENILTITPSLSTVTSDSLYSVYYTYESCPSDTIQIALHINGLPAVSVENDTICFGDVGSLTAAAVPSSTSGTYNWSPGNITSSSINLPNLVVASSAIDSIHVYNVTYTDSVGCSNQASGFVTVYQNPEVLAPSVTICEGDTAQLEAVSNIPNGIYNWYAAGDYTSSIGNGSSITLSGLSSASYIYNVVYVVNGCSDTATVNLTVNAKPDISILGQDTLLFCPGAQPIALLTTVTPTGIGGNYLWLHDNSTNPTTTISPSVSSVYEVQFTSDDGCQSDLDQVFVTVVNNAFAEIEAIPGDTICSGESVVLSVSQVGANYSWSTLETTQSITDTLFSNGNIPQIYTYNVTVTIPGCSEVAVDTIQIVVNPIPNILSLTVDSDTLCLGNEALFSVTSEPSGGFYTWTPGSVTNTATFTNTPGNVGLNLYNLQYEVNGCFDNDSIEVFVNPTPIIELTSGDKICSGDTAVVSAQADISGGVYVWYQDGFQIGQGNTFTIAPSDTVLLEMVYTTSGDYGCPSDTSFSIVEVYPVPEIIDLNSFNICPDSLSILDATTDIVGGNYIWSDDVNSGVAYGNTNPISVSPSDTTLFTLVYEMPYANNTVFCYDTAQSLINIYETPVIGDIFDTICSSSSFNIVPENLSPNIIPTGTMYEWTYFNNPLVAGASDNLTLSPNISDGPLINSVSLGQTVTYTVYPVSGTVGNCPGTPFNLDIYITSSPQITDKFDTICSGSSPSITAEISDVYPIGTSFEWVVIQDNSNITGQTSNQSGSLTNLDNQQLINITDTIQSLIYAVSPIAGSCFGDNFLLTVSILPAPSIQNAVDTICSDQPWVYYPGSIDDIVPIGTQFDWSVNFINTVENETSNFGVFEDSIFQLNPNIINLTSEEQIIIYNVIPTYSGCAGDTFDIALSVAPKPVLLDHSITACSGSSITYVPQDGLINQVVPEGTLFSWQEITSNPNIQGVQNSSAPQETISFDLFNLTDVQQTANFEVIAENGFCVGDTFLLTLNIDPVPTVANLYDTICSGSSYCGVPLNSIIPSGTLYSWPAPSIDPNNMIVSSDGNPFAAGQNSNCVGYSSVLSLENISNPSFVAEMTFEVTPSYGVCVGAPFEAHLFVYPTPEVNAYAEDSVICPGFQTLLYATGTPDTTLLGVPGVYEWQNSTDIFGSNLGDSVYTIPIDNSTAYSVTYTLNGCSSQPDDVIVGVQPAPIITSITASEPSICEDGCTELTANFTGNDIVDFVIWSTGDTTYSSPHSIVVCPSDTGFFQYYASAFLGTCFGNTDSVLVTVNLDPIFTLQPISDTALCVGGTYPIEIDVDFGVGSPSYQWYVNDSAFTLNGQLIPGAVNAEYTPPNFINAGTYYYFCEVNYVPSGCETIFSDFSLIDVIDDPVVSVIPGSPQKLCIGGDVECLTASVSGGVGENGYLWSPGGAIDSVFCPFADTVGVNIYSVSIVQTGIGCSSLPSNEVIVEVVPDPTITIFGEVEVCEGAEVPLTTLNTNGVSTISGGVGPIDSYQWQISQPVGVPYVDIDNEISASHTTSPLDADVSYQLTATQTGSGCEATDEHFINVVDDPILIVDYDSLVCVNEETQFIASVIGGLGQPLYQWFETDSLNVGYGIPLTNPTTESIYSFTYYDPYYHNYYGVLSMTGFGCDNDTTEMIFVESLDFAISSFEVEPDSLQQFITEPTFSFVNTSEFATNYQWDLGECDDPLPYSDLYASPTQFYDPFAESIYDYTYGCPPGQYVVTLVASNENLCFDTSQVVVSIIDKVILYVPNTFTPDGNDVNPIFMPVLSSYIDPTFYELSIFDRWGQVLFETNDRGKGWDGTVNGKVSQDGTYVWKVTYDNATTGERVFELGHVNLIR